MAAAGIKTTRREHPHTRKICGICGRCVLPCRAVQHGFIERSRSCFVSFGEYCVESCCGIYTFVCMWNAYDIRATVSTVHARARTQTRNMQTSEFIVRFGAARDTSSMPVYMNIKNKRRRLQAHIDIVSRFGRIVCTMCFCMSMVLCACT